LRSAMKATKPTTMLANPSGRIHETPTNSHGSREIGGALEGRSAACTLRRGALGRSAVCALGRSAACALSSSAGGALLGRAAECAFGPCDGLAAPPNELGWSGDVGTGVYHWVDPLRSVEACVGAEYRGADAMECEGWVWVSCGE
jgi:hypothetical protein